MVDEYDGKAKFWHADILKAPGTTQQFGVHFIPTLVLCTDGVAAGALLGD